MDGHDLLNALHDITEFESVGDDPQHEAPDLSGCVTHVTAGSRKMPVLKTLMTSACERNCFYCPFRAGRSSMKRVTFTPDDMARGFMALYRAKAVEGIFLSSGIIRGGVTTQDKIIATGEILRKKYNFRGYIHLKVMPGAERDQIVRAMQLANRVSVNLEAPNQHHLNQIAPGKNFHEELLTRLEWIEDLRQQSEGRLRASSTTEFVVGAVDDRDVEILNTTHYLHQHAGLARAYFSAFRPVTETPFENGVAADPARKVRLYQASFLLRDYGFDVEELPFTSIGDLPLDTDPKRAWAEENLAQTPLELNTASEQELLRVPGIGLKGAKQIVAARGQNRLRYLEDLQAVGITNVQRAAPYVLLDGHRPFHQQKLF